MAKDNNFARVLKTTLPPTIARKLVTLTPLRSVRYHKQTRRAHANVVCQPAKGFVRYEPHASTTTSRDASPAHLPLLRPDRSLLCPFLASATDVSGQRASLAQIAFAMERTGGEKENWHVHPPLRGARRLKKEKEK